MRGTRRSERAVLSCWAWRSRVEGALQNRRQQAALRSGLTNLRHRRDEAFQNVDFEADGPS